VIRTRNETRLADSDWMRRPIRFDPRRTVAVMRHGLSIVAVIATPRRRTVLSFCRVAPRRRRVGARAAGG
jgi:hypothetical protein